MHVEGRWTPRLPFPAGPYSPEKVSEAIGLVRTAIDADSNREAELQEVGAVSIVFIDACVQVVDEQRCADAVGAPRCVDVSIRPHTLRLDLYRVGSNILPVPRANRPTFFEEVPAPLRALNPSVGFDHDREFGPSSRAAIRANLLDLPKIVRGEPVTPADTQLQLLASGRKSLTERFYNVDAGLSLSWRGRGQFLDTFALDGGYAADAEPLGDATHVRHSARAGGTLTLRPPLEPVRTATLGLAYHWSRDKLHDGAGRDQLHDGAGRRATTENGVQGSAVVDGRVAGGFTRLAVWGEHEEPSGTLAAYRRLAGMLGYEREFPIAINQTVGVEVIVGGGRADRSTPEYARFFGGNSARNFLYDAADTRALTAFPPGPLIRSFGEGQAGAVGARSPRGGTSYWNVNLNIALPVPPWSRPLIPAEVVTSTTGPDGRERDVTLKEVLKNQAAQGEPILAAALKRRGLPPEDAAAQARETFAGIRPLVDFIADQANLYAVKPLVMADVARIERAGSGDDVTRVAVGAGVQLTVVVARFELGYLRTVRRAPGDDRGNLFVRLTFQNLF
jgi:hypothetical protein